MKRLISLFLGLTLAMHVSANTNIQFAQEAQKDSKHVVLFVSDASSLQGAAKMVDDATDGRLSAALSASGFDGSFGSSEGFYGLTPYQHVVVVGSESEEKLTSSQLTDLGGHAAQGVPSEGLVSIHADGLNTDQENHASFIALGYKLQSYTFDKYQKTDEKKAADRDVHLITAQSDAAASRYNNDLKHMAEGIYLARDMASEPGNTIYPQAFVDVVKRQFKGVDNIDIDVLDVKDMKRNNMGALMGVGKGSVHDPRLLVISYNGADSDEAPIALVGKGITFDTGGISIKSNATMWFMKSDLSGAAAVAGTMLSIAKSGDKVNVVGLMPLAENMPASDAIRPGDVLNTMQGTTIEIRSTDAEGRLILADAVTYAQREFKPKMLLNIATLTGSAARALSDEYAAVITRDFALSQKMMEVGEASGEHVWPLPLHPNHFKQIKSDFADIKNSGAGSPGASIGAAVVGTFVDESLPWVHLDIAGVDYLDSSTATTPKGFAGWGVRFMDEFVRQHSN